MEQFKELSEAIRVALDWLVDFISKPLAGWSFTIAIVIFGYIKIESKYKDGVFDGKESAQSELISLKAAAKYDSTRITKLQKKNDYLEIKLDTCQSSSGSDFEKEARKRLEEADRLNDLFKKRYNSVNEINKELKTVPIK